MYTIMEEDESMADQSWAHLNTSNPFRSSEHKLNTTNPSTSQLGQGEGREGGKDGSGMKEGCVGTVLSSVAVTRSQLDRDMLSALQQMDRERSLIMQEMESEENQRKWYEEQLEKISAKLDAIPVTDTFNVQADVARRQLDYDARRLRDAALETLGTPETASLRHEARLQRVHTIQTQMVRLKQSHQRQHEAEKRDSGTCDHLERDENGVVVTDAATNTNTDPTPHDGGVREPTDPISSGASSLKLFCSGTQTADHYSQDSYYSGQDGAGCQVPNQNLTALYHGGWPITSGVGAEGGFPPSIPQDMASVMSFHSSNISSTSSQNHGNQQQLGTKVEMVYSLLSMLGTHDKDDMSRTLLAMSSSQDSCIAMRQSGCLPLLIQLLHGSDKDSGLLGNTRGSKTARDRAAAALHNIVHSHPDDKRGRREARVLRLLEQIRAHCDHLREVTATEHAEEAASVAPAVPDMDHHPGPAIAALMKLSFDEEHRHAICTLGGLQAIAELLQLDHDSNGNTIEQYNITMRRYACMALTNLTFGDGTNKALLCSMKAAMRGLVAQLHSANEDLRQVAASVLRNLSWRADLASKKTLREVQSVAALSTAAIEVKKESTLKSILSALWNLSAHCSENKADICAVDGALEFLVGILQYKSPSKTTSIIENGGGILRNVSSHIAVREDYRKIIRQHGCLQLLLKHLRSPSLTIVSNACGTLWNLSARCPEDQKALWELGAVNMLKNLVHSKHKMISMGSAAALKNLLSARPSLHNIEDNVFTKPNVPGLHVRKQRHLEAELDSQNLSETCENLESPQGSPTEQRKHNNQLKNKCVFPADNRGMYGMDIDPRRPVLQNSGLQKSFGMDAERNSRSAQQSLSLSGSQDSVGSTHSDTSHDRARINSMLNRSKLLQERPTLGGDRRHRDHSAGKGNVREELSSEPNRSGPNSRIIQAMQEVALAAGLDGGNRRESQSAENTPASMRKTQQQTPNQGRIPVFRGQGSIPKSNVNDGQIKLNNEHLSSATSKHVNFTHLSQRMENLHLGEPEQDEPINYSMKYSEAPKNATAQRPSNQMNRTQDSAFVKPIPKLQNYVGDVTGNRNYPVSCDAELMPPPPAPITSRPTSDTKTSNIAQPRTRRQGRQRADYAETDLDGDQPTNFGRIYAEQDEDESFTDQPVNYSTRFSEPEVGRTYNNDMQDLDDDTTRTFCTEGTPLNYLSTATSMNDLTGKTNIAKKEGENMGAPKQGLTRQQQATSKSRQQQQEVLNLSVKSSGDSEKLSLTNSQSTDRNTGSTVILRCEMSDSNVQNNNVVPQRMPESTDGGVHLSQPASMYSYNDSTGTSSPSEKPRQYCTEGTPTCFSRVSSLSSLHSSDAQDQQSATSHNTSGGHKHDLVLQSIDENDSLQIDPNDVTLKPGQANESYQSSGNTSLPNTPGGSHQTKTVTFDENNQVQETPLMFSRCSSLGSLSSFDAHSVHSSVVSEYSRRASEVVSPSELPDSPSDTMPPSPSQRKSPVKFSMEMNADAKPLPKASHQNQTRVLQPKSTPQAAVKKPSPQRKLFEDSAVCYADEGSPGEDFSCATSLSALTIDDEPKIKKEPNLRRVLQDSHDESQDDSVIRSSNELVMAMEMSLNETVVEKPQPKVTSKSEDEDDDIDVSEGEENILAECISLGMPTKSSKKVKKSSSDGFLKSRAEGRKQATENQNQGQKVPPNIPTSRSMGTISQQAPPPPPPQDVPEGYDTPLKFSTEDTPLNFSGTGSLSDLSMDSHKAGDGASCPDKADLVATQQALQDEEHDDSDDLSSLSGGDEDLLSAAIESAMPKSKKKPEKMDRVAEGSDGKDSYSFQSPMFKKPYPVARQPQQQYQPHMGTPARPQQPVSAMPKQPQPTGIPLPRPQQQPQLPVVTPRQPHGPPQGSSVTPQKSQPYPPSTNPCPDIGGDDCTTMYAVEGTPVNFSRRTSLSDMTTDSDFKDDGNVTKTSTQATMLPQIKTPTKSSASGYNDHTITSNDSPRVFGMEGTPVSFSRNDSLSSLSSDEDDFCEDQSAKENTKVRGAKKQDLQCRAISRLKTPSKSQKHTFGPSCTSTPHQSKLAVHHQESNSTDDQVKSYAVEGTPSCVSRSSPLSSLNSSDEAIEEPKPQSKGAPVGDQKRTFKIEDTPAVFSLNSSLSSLSVESLSFDPTPSESALLEECINAAMPKSRKKKPQAPQPESVDQRSIPFNLTEGAQGNEPSTSNQPKNGERPQAERESRDIFEAPTNAVKVILKDEKDASNQERQALQQSSDSCIVDDADRSHYVEATIPDEEPSTSQEQLSSPENEDNLVDTVINYDMIGSTEFEQTLCLEAKICAEAVEKEKMEMSDTSDRSAATYTICFGRSDSTESMPQVPMVDSSNSSADIMKESFPEMSSSLLSSVTTPDYELAPNPLPLDNAKLDEADLTIQNDDSGGDLDNPTLTDAPVKNHDITQEDEKLLEENANIILSALSFNRGLSGSGMDDDMFIDNETISLVSNDDIPDNVSEVSCSLSCSSKAMSEQASETSASTLSPNQNIATKGPRIVKPVCRESVKNQLDKDTGPKPIRGKRRSLSAPRVVATKETPAANSTSPKGPKPVVPRRSTSVGPQKNTAAPSAGARVPSRGNSPGVKSAASVPKKSPPRTVPVKGSSGSPVQKVAPVKTTAKNSASPTTRGNSPMSQKPQSSPTKPANKTGKLIKAQASKLPSPSKPAAPSRLPVKPNGGKIPVVERPAPPIKQGTFTKEEPTQNIPTISPTKNSASLPGSARNSADGEQCGKSETASGTHISRRSSQSKASSKEEERAKDGAVGTLSQSPSISSNKTSPVVTKTASGGTLYKSGSGASLNKTGSNSSLKSIGSTSSKTPPRSSIPGTRGSTPTRSSSIASVKSSSPRNSANLNKSDSQSSLKKCSSPLSKGPTPPSRRNSATGATSGVQVVKEKTSITNQTSGGPIPKKPAVSKIAGLWKKDKKVESVDKEISYVPAVASDVSGSLQQSEITNPIPKSSTYDKLSPETHEASDKSVGSEVVQSSLRPAPDGLDSEAADSKVPSDVKSASWRRTYTIDTDEDAQALMPPPPSAEPVQQKPSKNETKGKGHKMSLSLWRRGSHSESKDKKKESSADGVTTDAPVQKKKGFSLFRKDSSKSSSKIPGKGGKNTELSATEKSMTLPMNGRSPSEDLSAKSSTLPRQLNGGDSLKSAFQVSSPLASPTRNQPPAVAVPPFNYKPTSTSTNPADTQSGSGEPVAPLKSHMTKTEMLMARRRQSYMNSVKNESENDMEESSEGKKSSAPLVTTV